MDDVRTDRCRALRDLRTRQGRTLSLPLLRQPAQANRRGVAVPARLSRERGDEKATIASSAIG